MPGTYHPEVCDIDVCTRGEVLHIEHLPKAEAEGYCNALRNQYPTARVDWHYVAGRAVFKKLEVAG